MITEDTNTLIKELVGKKFSKTVNITVIIGNSNLDPERKEKIDKTIPSIAFSSIAVEKYISNIREKLIKDGRTMKVFYAFLEDFEEKIENNSAQKILDLIQQSTIVILACDIKSIADYALYYQFIEYLNEHSAELFKMDWVPACNLFFIKSRSAPLVDLAIDKLSTFFSFPASSIIVWDADSSSELRSNLTGFEQIKDTIDKQVFLKEKVDKCIAHTIVQMF